MERTYGNEEAGYGSLGARLDDPREKSRHLAQGRDAKSHPQSLLRHARQVRVDGSPPQSPGAARRREESRISTSRQPQRGRSSGSGTERLARLVRREVLCPDSDDVPHRA